MIRAGAVQIYAHSANAAFAERLAAALDAAGYEIVTGPFDRQAVDAVIVVWSGAAIGSARLLEAARGPLDCGVLVPVSIGMVEPPYGFQHLPPVNLGGWTGEAGDPRWRRVLDEIEASAYAVRGPAPGAGHCAEAAPAQPVRHAADGRARAVFSGVVSGVGSAAGAAARVMKPLIGAAARVPRAPVAAGLVLISVMLLAGFLLITPNSDAPATMVASAPSVETAAPQQPPMIAAAQLPEAPSGLEPAPELDEEAGLSQTRVEAPREEPAAGRSASAAFADADLAEGEVAGAVIAEGDTDYPEAEASIEQTATPAAPSRAQAPGGEEHDRIASLIASSVSSSAPATNNPRTEEGAAIPSGLFRDCSFCPEMAPIPPGAFLMGTPPSEPARQPEEGPQVEVTIPRAFALGAKEVTFEQWSACVADGGCAHRPHDAGWGGGARPVINVSWDDAQAYAAWLSKKTGENYRLPSEEEWEYAARAGAKTPFVSGPVISTDQANFDGAHPYGGDLGKVRGRTTPAGSFAANPFGLYDMNGNVWEWVADCWSASHENASPDGAPRGGACSSRVLKGGAWNTGGWRLRAGHRIGKREDAREYDNGFRVARDLG